MFYLLGGIGAFVAVFLFGLVLFAKSSFGEPRLLVCLAFERPTPFDGDGLVDHLKGRWNLDCKVEGNDEGDYVIRFADDEVLLHVRKEPLPAKLALLLEKIPSTLADGEPSDCTRLREHRAHWALQWDGVELDHGSAALVTMQVLVCLLEQYEQIIGCVNVPAMRYDGRRELLSLLGFQEPSAAQLYKALVNMHVVAEEDGSSIHTHGMEQFALPDIEVECPNDDEARIFHIELVANTAAYIIAEGPILNVGDSGELQGDGIIYRVCDIDEDRKDEYGSFGAIALVREAAGAGGADAVAATVDGAAGDEVGGKVMSANKRKKKVPTFKSEGEEAEFWANNSPDDYDLEVVDMTFEFSKPLQEKRGKRKSNRPSRQA